MQEKNKHLKKNWHLKPTKNLLFFYSGAIKAGPTRKLRRLCKQHNILLWTLPSSFRIPTSLYAQGPGFSAICANKMNYSSYKRLTKLRSSVIFEKQRAFSATFLAEIDSTQKAQDLCFGLLDIVDIKISTNENFKINPFL